MTEQLGFADVAHLGTEEAVGIASCLVQLLGSAVRRHPVLGELAGARWPRQEATLQRERCLDACAVLLELSSMARRRGRYVDAFALEGIEALLLDALVEGTGR